MKKLTWDELLQMPAGQLRKHIIKLQDKVHGLASDAKDGRVTKANQKVAKDITE